MIDIWEDARNAWLRSERGDYGHYDDRKIKAAISRGRELEDALREWIMAHDSERAAAKEEEQDRIRERTQARTRLDSAIRAARAVLGEEPKR